MAKIWKKNLLRFLPFRGLFGWVRLNLENSRFFLIEPFPNLTLKDFLGVIFKKLDRMKEELVDTTHSSFLGFPESLAFIVFLLFVNLTSLSSHFLSGKTGVG